MMIRSDDCSYSFLVFIEDPYSMHKNHISEIGSVTTFRCRHTKQFLLLFFHAKYAAQYALCYTFASEDDNRTLFL